MKCKSCETEINPKWKHAIDTNKCPFCGSEIMEEKLKNLFLTLSSTLSALEEFPDQLNDWMLSNHSYIKTNSPNLKLFLPKEYVKEEEKEVKKEIVTVKVSDGEEQEVEVKKIQSDKRTDEFFKRAEAVKPNIDGFKNTSEKTQHLKSLAAQIKRAGTGAGNAQVLLDGDTEGADPEELAELQSMIQLESSPSSGFESDEDIPAAVLAMANSKGGITSNKDLLKLQQMQNRINNSKENFESGASRGKGGFSRSG